MLTLRAAGKTGRAKASRPAQVSKSFRNVSRAKTLASGTSRFLNQPDKVAIYRGIGFPDEFVTDLVYTKSAVVATTAAADFQQLQSSLFDPDPAIGGTQPLFFDQFAGVYAWYQVLEMTATVEVSTTGGSTTPLSIAYGWSDEASPSVTVDGLSNTRFGKAGLVIQARPWLASSKMTMERIHGYSDITQVDSLQALVSANPADLAYFTVGTVPFDGTTSTARFVRIRMVYRARFFGLITPAAS